MHRLAFVFAALSLVACTVTSSPSSSSPCADAGLELDASTPDVSAPDASPDVEAGPCALRVDSLSPSTVRGGELVTMRGCGFLGVRDVQVNVYSVPYRIVDDFTIVFTTWTPEDFVELPYSAAVDVIRIQPDQVQAFLTYTK